MFHLINYIFFHSCSELERESGQGRKLERYKTMFVKIGSYQKYLNLGILQKTYYVKMFDYVFEFKKIV